MKFSSIIILTLAISFTLITAGFFKQALDIGGIGTLSLSGWGILWGIAAGISYALFLRRWINCNL